MLDKYLDSCSRLILARETQTPKQFRMACLDLFHLLLVYSSMDKFVVREPKKKDPHLAVHKSAKDQVPNILAFFTQTMASFSVCRVILCWIT